MKLSTGHSRPGVWSPRRVKSEYGCGRGEPKIVGPRLVRLIERHADELAIGLSAKLRESERTTDFRKIPAEHLQKATAALYQNLGEWLLTKTEKDIEKHFVSLARRRAADGVGLQQFVWALVMSRNHLYRFLLGAALADSIFELYSELELQQLLDQFFERAIYYVVGAYENNDAMIRHGVVGELKRHLPSAPPD
jgi:hypothetical protein